MDWALAEEEVESILSPDPCECCEGPFFQNNRPEDWNRINRLIEERLGSDPTKTTKGDCGSNTGSPNEESAIACYTMVDMPSNAAPKCKTSRDEVLAVKSSGTEIEKTSAEVQPAVKAITQLVLVLMGYCTWCSKAVRAPVELGASY